MPPAGPGTGTSVWGRKSRGNSFQVVLLSHGHFQPQDARPSSLFVGYCLRRYGNCPLNTLLIEFTEFPSENAAHLAEVAPEGPSGPASRFSEG